MKMEPEQLAAQLLLQQLPEHETVVQTDELSTLHVAWFEKDISTQRQRNANIPASPWVIRTIATDTLKYAKIKESTHAVEMVATCRRSELNLP